MNVPSLGGGVGPRWGKPRGPGAVGRVPARAGDPPPSTVPLELYVPIPDLTTATLPTPPCSVVWSSWRRARADATAVTDAVPASPGPAGCRAGAPGSSAWPGAAWTLVDAARTTLVGLSVPTATGGAWTVTPARCPAGHPHRLHHAVRDGPVRRSSRAQPARLQPRHRAHAARGRAAGAAPAAVLAATPAYRPLRLTAAVVTGVAAVGWLLYRVGVPTVLSTVADGLGLASPWTVGVLWLAAAVVLIKRRGVGRPAALSGAAATYGFGSP